MNSYTSTTGSYVRAVPQRKGHTLTTPLAALVLGLLLALAGGARAANVPPGFTETVIPGPGGGGTWDSAVGVTFNEAGRMFVWELAGRVYFKDPADPGFTLLLDISEEVGIWSDHGLAGFALDPDFQANGNIYLLYAVDRHHLMNFGTGSYNPNSNDYFSPTIGRLTRYTCTVTNNFRSIDPASRFVLIGSSKTNGIPILSETHGVGSLVFGQDHTLLVSCGDGASPFVVDPGGTVTGSYVVQGLADGIVKPKENVGAFRSQLVDSLGGKILRIDPVTGDGVPSNPYYDAANPRSPKSRVWSVGTRNPFRMSLRPDSGDHDPAEGKPGVLYVGDVGWNNWESLDVVTAPKQNLGWPLFEGMEPTPVVNSETYNIDVFNQDAPNPQYPGGGCNQFFSFRQLLKQDTTAVADQPPFNNPCNAGVKIPTNTPQFLHKRPALDWSHSSAITRSGTYNGSGQATTANIGAAAPVTGTSFFGYCAVGGTWFTANTFPTQYVNTYFMADWGVGLIKNVVFTTNNTPVAVRDFASAAGGVVCMTQHPTDGSLYYISYDYAAGTIRKISYTGNRTPVPIAISDKTFGPGPLAVQFNGSGSSDPDAQALTYLWNFGDGTPNSTAANPSHTFTPPNGNAAPYTVTLTVTDSGGLSASTTLLIVANDTPPQVTITSPVHGTLYSMLSNTPFNLAATVIDAESPDNQLSYNWQTLLRHNGHEHLSSSTTNHAGSTLTEPNGCDGVNVLHYRILLTVTDPAGLATKAEIGLFPDCGAPDTAPTLSDIANQSTPLNTATAAIPFTIDDAQVIPANLQLSVTSSNLALVPLSKIVLGGSGGSRNVTLTPNAGLNGTSLITITVNDGPNNVSDSFLLTVGTNTPPPTTPTISDIPGQTTTINTPTAAIPFTIGDPDTAIASLTLSRNSSNTNLVPTNNIVFGGSSSNRTVTVTPATGLTGTATITVIVSDGTNSANDTFLLTVLPVNTPPAISGIANQVINEDNNTGPLAFTIVDAETAPASLTLGKASSDLSLVPSNNIVFGGSGSNRTVTITPATNLSGSATITLTVGDGQYTASTNFTVTINAVNDAPTITSIANQSIGVSATTGPLAFTVGDVETAAASLTVGGSSSNPTLVPNGNIVFGGSGASRNVTVTPVAGQTGTASIMVSVSDGALTTSNTFNVTVSAQPAGLVAAYSFNEGSGTTVADVSGNTNNGAIGTATWITTGRYSNALNFNGTSARVTVNDSASLDLTTNMTLEAWVYPTAGGGWRDVIYKGVDDIYYLMGSSDTGAPAVGGTFTPSPLRGPASLPLNTWTHLAGTYDGTTMRLFTNGAQVASVAQTGLIQTSTAALTIGGDALYGQYFSGRIDDVRIYNRALSAVEIQADMNTPVGATPSQPPTISDISNQVTTVNTPTAAIPFTITDADTAVASLTLSRNSSNTNLVPTNNIVFGGSSSNRTVTVTPATGQSGTATITVIVSDGTNTASDTFLLTVNTVNTAPTISGIASSVINEDNNTGPVAFIISDAETAAASLTLDKTSSNTSLVPTNNIVFGGSGSNRTMTVTPVANLSGIATITVTVGDGVLSASTNFTVTVNAVNDAPTLSSITNRTIAQDATTGPVSFTVGDVETAAGSLTLSGDSSNLPLVPTNNIVFGGSGANRTVTVTPVAGQNGTATITLSVSDGALATNTSFVLTVTPFTTVTQSFTNVAAITIPSSGAASPYPSTITVAGLSGNVSNVTVTLFGLSHTRPDDIDVLLVGPGGQKAILMADVGGANSLTNINLTLSGAASSALPNNNRINAGTYRPSNFSPSDTFPAPAPGTPYAGSFSTFIGQTPNGTWSLYVFDDQAGSAGSLGTGWSLTLTTGTGTGNAAPPSGPISINTIEFLDPTLLRLAGTGDSNRTYSVEISSDLISWEELGQTTADGTGAFEFVDDLVGETTNRFYRLTTQ